ncbi:CbtB domain-containing protein [Oricola sp.]
MSASARLTTALFAGVFGIALLYFAAFAHSGALHNGAHDTRHAIVAPCH